MMSKKTTKKNRHHHCRRLLQFELIIKKNLPKKKPNREHPNITIYMNQTHTHTEQTAIMVYGTNSN